jgi:hypothetical protein
LCDLKSRLELYLCGMNQKVECAHILREANFAKPLRYATTYQLRESSSNKSPDTPN